MTSVKEDLKCEVCSNFQISLLQSQMDPPVDEALGQVDIFVRSSGQTDLWSDVPHRIRIEVRLTFGHTLGQTDLWSDIPPGSVFRSG